MKQEIIKILESKNYSHLATDKFIKQYTAKANRNLKGASVKFLRAHYIAEMIILNEK
jgi:hypothetical protein